MGWPSKFKKIIVGVAGLVLVFGALYAYRVFRYEPPQRAFYFWKTRWNASSEMLAHLDQSEVRKLYMRFFDVEWNNVNARPQPVSPIDFVTALPSRAEIVPVVYLTNEIFVKIAYADIQSLSDKVWAKVSQMASQQKISFRQFQIDCDWSDSSKKNYFHFASLLAQKAKAAQVVLSSTIRLHQIKYVRRTGIPPVERGMLMFYNFGKIRADGARSSIFNFDDAKRYTSYIADYRLPLDIALPLFSWVVHSREGKILALLDKFNASELDVAEGFEKLSAFRYAAKDSFFYHGRYFVKGDLLLVEETSPEVTRQAAALAIRGASWKKGYETVAFFDLDERNLDRYDNKEITGIFNQF